MVIEKFIEYLQVEKRYSPHTVTSYRKDVEDFVVFLTTVGGSQDLLHVSKKNIRNFIIHLNENNLSKRSINRKISSLRTLYLYLLKIGEIKISPLEGVQSLKFYAEKQIPISQQELDDLQVKLSMIDQKDQILANTVIETLYQTGMRKSELCNLLFQNVDLMGKQMKIHGKGNKERIIPISEALLKNLQFFLDWREKTGTQEVYFFVNEKGKKMGEKFVYLLVNNYLSLVSSKKKKSPHMLRHSFATHVLDAGADISSVKKIMGHSSLASTQVYTNASIEQLKKVFNQAHPRAIKEQD